MTRIAADDAKAMDQLFTQAVTSGCKTAGIVDEKSPMNDGQAFKDHEGYVEALEAILSDDKKGGSGEFSDPNNVILD